MKTIAIDENSHEILKKAKESARKAGIENPSFSDAIRRLYDEAQKEVQREMKAIEKACEAVPNKDLREFIRKLLEEEVKADEF
jgi:predicted CopG family antitoxin